MSAIRPSADGFPILGEVFAVEFANTRYSHASGIVDFLESTELIVAWFAQAPAAAALRCPARVAVGDVANVRAVRDAVHVLLGALVDDVGVVASSAVAVLNRAAARSSVHPRLVWDASAGPEVGIVHGGRPADRFVAEIASTCMAFFAGPDARRVRRCARPECEMTFVQRHGARRFCHDTCSHRARQARYAHASRGSRQGGGR